MAADPMVMEFAGAVGLPLLVLSLAEPVMTAALLLTFVGGI